MKQAKLGQLYFLLANINKHIKNVSINTEIINKILKTNLKVNFPYLSIFLE